ncbi:hypothetical protein [Photobacterium leiognathi]|uniref:hypothetical protein n=1 Tax=Photobacterium leiognathi TaxID=553611 RepID=UPI00273A2B91|nr:hypothetical protein [Photobacterium leiognathi]
MNVKTLLLPSILFTSCCHVYAGLGNRTAEISLNPSVKIVNEQGGSGIEIVPDKKEYTTVYDVGAGTFLPMAMGFNVVSTKSTPIKYELNLNVQNYCREEGKNDDKRMIGVKYLLDGKPVSASSTTNEITAGVFSTSNEKWHELKYKFPILLQDNTFKTCYGFVGITARLSNTY